MTVKLRKHWSTEKFDGKVFQFKDAFSDDIEAARKLAKKWRALGYNARITKGEGVWGGRYTYGVYVRKAKSVSLKEAKAKIKR